MDGARCGKDGTGLERMGWNIERMHGCFTLIGLGKERMGLGMERMG